MCATCGCSGEEAPHDHEHHEHDHPHPHTHGEQRRIQLERNVLAKNDALAARNRALFAEREIAAFNLVSSPGSGKTTLLEETVRRLTGRVRMAALEGDQETENDAERLRAVNCPVVQINTGAVCHLDAAMVAGGLERLDPPPRSLLFVENVGNLVCPAMFDLGERAKIAVMSVTEGEDKPLKYPQMFRASDVLVLNKIDLLPWVPFDFEACLANARRVNPRLQVFWVSATTGTGLDDWCGWLASQVPKG